MAAEKQIEVFHGTRHLWFIPTGIIVGALIFLPGDASGVFLFLIILFAAFREFGALFRSGAQRIVVTTHRIRGEVQYGILSGRPKTSFSIPYSEIIDVDSFLFGKGISLRIAGHAKPIKIIGIADSFVLTNFLQNILAIIKNRVTIEDGGEIDPVVSPRPWPNKYSPLSLCIHETTDLVAARIPDGDEPFEPLDLSPGDAVVDRRGGWLRWAGFGVAGLAAVGAILVIGAYTVAVTDSQKRLGGNTICITAARAYRKALPQSVNILLKRLDNDPSRAFNRSVASAILGNLMSDAYRDDVFSKNSDIQCGLKLAAEYYDNGTIATEIANQIQSEFLALLH